MCDKFAVGLALGARGKVSIVVCRANPHIPHQQREADHHGGDPSRAAEFKVARVVDLGVGALLPAIDNALCGLCLLVLMEIVGLARFCVAILLRLLLRGIGAGGVAVRLGSGFEGGQLVAAAGKLWS